MVRPDEIVTQDPERAQGLRNVQTDEPAHALLLVLHIQLQYVLFRGERELLAADFESNVRQAVKLVAVDHGWTARTQHVGLLACQVQDGLDFLLRLLSGEGLLHKLDRGSARIASHRALKVADTPALETAVTPRAHCRISLFDHLEGPFHRHEHRVRLGNSPRCLAHASVHAHVLRRERLYIRDDFRDRLLDLLLAFHDDRRACADRIVEPGHLVRRPCQKTGACVCDCLTPVHAHPKIHAVHFELPVSSPGHRRPRMLPLVVIRIGPAEDDLTTVVGVILVPIQPEREDRLQVRICLEKILKRRIDLPDGDFRETHAQDAVKRRGDKRQAWLVDGLRKHLAGHLEPAHLQRILRKESIQRTGTILYGKLAPVLLVRGGP
mmetsp:Transcript_15585/g.44335  ORF Transcript_15585/g.44335 Transcript_15585/m.44335 type:complete len:380 (+) Transcript_15585:1415-2554(+)